MKPDLAMIEAVVRWQKPRNVKELQSFLGFANYYRDFFPNFSERAHPLKELTRKSKAWEWTPECSERFAQLKLSLTTAPVLNLPESEGRFVLDTDASNVAISGVLSQLQGPEQQEKRIAYGSKSLSETEMRYGAPKAEMLAAVNFIEKFRAFLTRGEFALRADNNALSWLKKYSMTKGMAARWI